MENARLNHSAICGYPDVYRVVHDEPTYPVVSIMDSNQQPAVFTTPGSRRILALSFDDCDRGNNPYGYQSPSIFDVKKVINFAQELEPQPIIVHCQAGISRSSAMMAGIFRVWCNSDQEALDLIVEVQKNSAQRGWREKDLRIHPNSRIIGLFDVALGLGGSFVKQYTSIWDRAHMTPAYILEDANG